MLAHAARAGAALAPERIEVVVEVDLHRVALGGDVALEHLRALALHVLPQRGGRRQRVLAAQVRGDPLPLRLRERHDRAERLQQPDEEDVVDVRVEDAAEQRQVVVRRADQVRIEERERHLVAGAPHDRVDLLDRAVLEAHAVAQQLGDVRLVADLAVRDAVEEVGGDRRMRVAEVVVRSRQAVVLHLADADAVEAREDRLAEGPRQRAGELVDADLVERAAEQVLGDDVRAAARGQPRRVRDEARLDGDVHRAVAHPHDDDASALERLVVDVVVRVRLRRRRSCRGTAARASAGPSGGRWRRRARRSGASPPCRARSSRCRRPRARRARRRSRTGCGRGSRSGRRRRRSTRRSGCDAGSPDTTSASGSRCTPSARARC